MKCKASSPVLRTGHYYIRTIVYNFYEDVALCSFTDVGAGNDVHLHIGTEAARVRHRTAPSVPAVCQSVDGGHRTLCEDLHARWPHSHLVTGGGRCLRPSQTGSSRSRYYFIISNVLLSLTFTGPATSPHRSHKYTSHDKSLDKCIV